MNHESYDAWQSCFNKEELMEKVARKMKEVSLYKMLSEFDEFKNDIGASAQMLGKPRNWRVR